MRRLGRILLNVIVVLSLLLWMATIVTWVWSYREAAVITYYSSAESRGGYFPRWDCSLASSAGGVRLGISTWDESRDAESAWRHYTYKGPGYPNLRYRAEFQEGESGYTVGGRFGFSRYSLRWNQRNRESFSLVVPHWALAVVWGMLPSLRLVSFVRGRRRRSRRRSGLCVRCGYDLRATPDRCPECGAVPNSAAQPLARR